MDYEFTTLRATANATPAANAIATDFNFTFTGGTEFFIVGFSVRRSAGTIDQLAVSDTSPIVTRWGIFVDPPAASWATAAFTSPFKVDVNTTVAISHSQTASGFLELIFTYKVKG